MECCTGTVVNLIFVELFSQFLGELPASAVGPAKNDGRMIAARIDPDEAVPERTRGDVLDLSFYPFSFLEYCVDRGDNVGDRIIGADLAAAVGGGGKYLLYADG